MALNGTWVPQSREEDRLMEDIHIATRRAHADGVSKQRIAALLAFMSSATLDPASMEEAEQRADRPTMEEAFEEAMGGSDEMEPKKCPKCGTPISDVIAQMGGVLIVQSCDCHFTWNERERLGDWVEEFEPEEGSDGE